jgi:hypothetical protein
VLLGLPKRTNELVVLAWIIVQAERNEKLRTKTLASSDAGDWAEPPGGLGICLSVPETFTAVRG